MTTPVVLQSNIEDVSAVVHTLKHFLKHVEILRKSRDLSGQIPTLFCLFRFEVPIKRLHTATGSYSSNIGDFEIFYFIANPSKKISCASITEPKLVMSNIFRWFERKSMNNFLSETVGLETGICIKNADAEFTPTMNHHNFFARWVRLVVENKPIVFFTKFFTYNYNCLPLFTIVYNLYWRSVT